MVAMDRMCIEERRKMKASLVSIFAARVLLLLLLLLLFWLLLFTWLWLLLLLPLTFDNDAFELECKFIDRKSVTVFTDIPPFWMC